MRQPMIIMIIIDTSECSGQIAMETLYPSLNIKGFYGDKFAIPQGY